MGLKNKLLILCAISVLAINEKAWADNSSDDMGQNNNTINNSGANASNANSSNQLFNTQIYSLSKKKEDAFDAPSSTYIITSEDIRRSGLSNIAEALRLAPGIQVAKIDGNSYAISSRGFNSQYSNKLLILVDGRTVYTPVFSGTFWDITNYVLADVDRIEVIKGPGGTAWGANAVNGVINIITKNAADTQGAYGSTTISNGDKNVEARYGGKTNSNDHYRLYAKEYDGAESTKATTNAENHDGYTNSQAGFRYDIRSITDSNISLHGDVQRGVAKNYFQGLNTPDPTSKDSHGANLVLNWQETLSPKSSINFQTYFDYSQFSTYIINRGSETFDFDFQHFYNFTKDNQLAWGAGYRAIKDNMKDNPTLGTIAIPSYYPAMYSPAERNDGVASTFVQDKIGLITDKLDLTIGSKLEHNDYTGLEYEPNAKLAWYPARDQTAWFSVSRAVRTPTRGENGLTFSGPTGPAQQGSVFYGSEDVLAYELGYRIKPIRTVMIDVSTFYNQYSNLRTFNGSHPTIASNTGDGNSYGGELVIKWQATSDLKLEAGYDLLHMNLTAEPGSNAATILPQVGQSPKNQFRLRAYYNITPKLEFDNMLYYVQSLPNATSSAASAFGTNAGVPAYTRVDTRLGYLLKEGVDLSCGIQNLFDKRHQEFSNGLFAPATETSRTFYLKLTLGL